MRSIGSWVQKQPLAAQPNHARSREVSAHEPPVGAHEPLLQDGVGSLPSF